MQLEAKTENRTENRTGNKAENKNRKTKAMKTKNNVQKAILRSGAVVVSFVLISFTVSAQDFWKRLLTNSSFNEIAIAMVETTGETKTTDFPAEHSADAFIFQEDAESAMELENWMTNTIYFNEIAVQFDEAVEQPLKLQDWMLDESHFNSNNNREKSMELEDWMTSDKFWNK